MFKVSVFFLFWGQLGKQVELHLVGEAEQFRALISGRCQAFRVAGQVVSQQGEERPLRRVLLFGPVSQHRTLRKAARRG